MSVDCTEHPDRKAISYTARCPDCYREFMRSGAPPRLDLTRDEADALLYPRWPNKARAGAQDKLRAFLAEGQNR